MIAGRNFFLSHDVGCEIIPCMYALHVSQKKTAFPALIKFSLADCIDKYYVETKFINEIE